MSSFIDKLEQLTDIRRKEGMRHKISTVITISILAIISNIYSLRGITGFAKRHHKELVKLLKIEKNRTPSFFVFRTVLQQVDFNELALIVKEWLIENNMLDDNDWLSIDGKAIRSTVEKYDSEQQNFVCIVSAFAQKSGLVLLAKKYENKKDSEIEIAESLIRAMGVENKIFTLDALHSKKNS